MLFLELLPVEIVELILYYIDNVTTFINLYNTNDNLIKKILESDIFWNNATSLKFGEIYNYSENARINIPKNKNPTVKFYNMINHYVKGIIAHKKAISLFLKLENSYIMIRNKFFAEKDNNEIKNKLVEMKNSNRKKYNLITSEGILININIKYLQDMEIFYELFEHATEVIESLSKSANDEISNTRTFLYTRADGIYIYFQLTHKNTHYRLIKNRVISLLFYLYYNNHNEFIFENVTWLD